MDSLYIPHPALAAPPPTCSGCSAKEVITASGIGTLACSNGISYPNTQISFNAVVPFKTVGSAKGSMTLSHNFTAQTQGMVTSGEWNPSGKTYFVSGTSTSDNICAIPGSQFTISGIIGPGVPISMDAKYTFQGTGNVVGKACGNC